MSHHGKLVRWCLNATMAFLVNARVEVERESCEQSIRFRMSSHFPPSPSFNEPIPSEPNPLEPELCTCNHPLQAYFVLFKKLTWFSLGHGS